MHPRALMCGLGVAEGEGGTVWQREKEWIVQTWVRLARKALLKVRALLLAFTCCFSVRCT